MSLTGRIILLIAFSCIFNGSFAIAQSNPTIRSGRPGQAIGAYVVGTGYFQIQSGFDHNWSNGSEESTSEVFGNVIRYGLNETVELSAVLNYQSDTFRSTDLARNETRSGVSSSQVGFRFNLLSEPDGWIPGIGFQTRFRTSAVDRDYKRDEIAPVMILSTNHHLSKTLSLGTNFGIVYDGNSPIPMYTYVANLGFPVARDWGGFVEIYGNTRDSKNGTFADTGLAYLLNNDFQLDLSGGFGSNSGVAASFVSVGFSWRSQTRNEPLHRASLY